MSVAMMKVLEQQVASLGRQVKELAAKNADLVAENELVRNLLTEFDKRHDLDAAEIARLSTPAGAAGVLLDQVMQKASDEAADMRGAMRDATLWAKVPSETRSQRWRYVGEALRALAAKEPAHD